VFDTWDLASKYLVELRPVVKALVAGVGQIEGRLLKRVDIRLPGQGGRTEPLGGTAALNNKIGIPKSPRDGSRDLSLAKTCQQSVVVEMLENGTSCESFRK
jgi:hypothetical protein